MTGQLGSNVHRFILWPVQWGTEIGTWVPCLGLVQMWRGVASGPKRSRVDAELIKTKARHDLSLL
jgi:hypothetical protein